MSAISGFHELIEGVLVGKQNIICKLMIGIINKNPLKSKYISICDLEQVLDYLMTISLNDHIVHMDLTLKLAILLALRVASRSSEITNLDISFQT